MRWVVLTIVCAASLWGCQSRSSNPEIVAKVSRNDALDVSAYLDAGGDPNLKSRDGDPLIYIASGPQGGIEVAKLLVAAGADVNGLSAEGRPVLHNAVSWCSTEMVALLLASGANLSAVDRDGRVALDVVCKSPHDNRPAVLNLLMGAQE